MKRMNANTALTMALSDALGLEASPANPITEAPPPKPLIPRPIESDDKISGDADYARSNILEIIEQGARAIEMASELAHESMHPRAFEVLGQLLKVQSDNVDKLLKLHADKKKLNTNDATQQGNTTINAANAIFFGTSDDLVRLMRREHTSPRIIELEDDE
jgi:hypothetical protein